MDVKKRIQVIVGDITLLQVDGIVNAANSSLLGGGGVDGAIHRVGGAEILTACRHIRKTEYPDGLPTGEAVSTTGGRLPCKGVIHTVGPVYSGDTKKMRRLLADAYRNSLEIAAEKQFISLAFPAISTGVYGYPKDIAADVAFSTIVEFLSKNEYPEQVYLVFFSVNDRKIFLDAVPDMRVQGKS